MSWDGAEASAKGYDYYVLMFWLLEWGFIFSFSLFARQLARGGHEKWQQWCLLPAYDCAIVFKKVGLVLIILMSGLKFDFGFGGWMASFALCFAVFLYQFTYITVLYALWAPSGGTRTMVRAIASTVVLAFFVGLLTTFNAGGETNTVLSASNTLQNTTYAYWPSFTAGGVGESDLTTKGTPQVPILFPAVSAIGFWVFIAQVVVGFVLGVAVAAGWLSPPRRPALFSTLYVLFVLTASFDYFTSWISVMDAFGFDAMVLWGVIEVPVKFYIMLMDSRYWTTLSLDGDNSNSSLDALQDDLTGQVAAKMRSSREEAACRVPHIHYTRHLEVPDCACAA